MGLPLRIVYPAMPPTANHIYVRGTVLKPPAREYRAAFKLYCSQNYFHLLQDISQETVLRVDISFFFDVENATFGNPHLPKSRRAKSRYKRVDLDNRLKFLLDCIRDVLGIDDSQVFSINLEKHQDAVKPRVDIYIQEVDPRLFGIRPRG